MIQRIQSLYLATVCITMVAFLRAAVWVKIGSDSLFTIRPYGLIASTGQYIIFPYGAPSLLICYLVLTAIYAIMRHDNRRLQLRLIAHMNLTLIVLMVLILVLINKANTTYLPNGYSSYKIATILPFIALIANLLAQRHIKKDEQLVNQDRLR
ncbi:MAG: DUF4293 domain-containing protein [Candidatus Cardinium sp.]|uniref:DUF4293 domain-containing protein n=1 Tax=Cardinium endosymbiont of Dermatophagoides farinae TaxID=2597823 RepID=UPI00164273E6|nr:DUF4293 domain-containing protein [Cardinium endosymbiont of Dermatophagoides farinae]UWW97320.1 MAG: DUF4293 domain-containing protein [Candidatus Cardinium sp.]